MARNEVRPQVVHVTPALFGREGVFGGGERYAFELARATSERIPTRLVTFGPRAARRRLGRLGIWVLPNRVPHKSGANPISELLVPAFGRAPVIHAHQYETAATNACLVFGRLLRRRVFVTDLGGAARNLARPLRLHRLVAEHLAISEHAAGYYPELTTRTTVVYGGVDTTLFRPNAAPRRREVVFVGRLLPHKGVHTLIQAVPADVPLHVYGQVYDAQYRAHLGELAKGRRVTFHGTADDDEIARAYSRARVAVLPSEPLPKSELLGLAPLEAMACGTPAVVTRTASLPEVVEDGVTGRVVEPDSPERLRQALLQLLGDDALWERMSVAAVERVLDRFTWPLTADRCIARYFPQEPRCRR